MQEDLQDALHAAAGPDSKDKGRFHTRVKQTLVRLPASFTAQ